MNHKIIENALILEDTMVAGIESGSQVIRDTTPFKLIKEPEIISEGTGDHIRKYMRLTGLVQKADWHNENGRYYPYEVMKEAVNNLQEYIGDRMVLGELDHPDDAKIHTENACLLLTKLWMEGKDVYAQFEVLEGMPKGQMLKCLIEQGVTISISSRGVGDMEVVMEDDGSEYNKVLPGFSFVCFDAVNEPSVKGTKLSVMESKQKQRRKAIKEARSKSEYALVKAMKEYLS